MQLGIVITSFVLHNLVFPALQDEMKFVGPEVNSFEVGRSKASALKFPPKLRTEDAEGDG